MAQDCSQPFIQEFCLSGISSTYPESEAIRVAIVVACLITNIFSIWVGVRLTNAWLSKIDYYPLKQKSPLLTLDLCLVFLLSINAYPLQLVFTYFAEKSSKTPYIYNTLYFSTRYIAYFIYLMRAVRIYFAYNVRNSNSFVFQKIFAKERRMTALVYGLMVFRLLVLYPGEHINPDRLGWMLSFSPISHIDNCRLQDQQDVAHMYMWRKFLQEFPWQLVLVGCVWMTHKVQSSLGYFKEYAVILFLNLAINFSEIIYFFVGWWTYHQKHNSEPFDKYVRLYVIGDCDTGSVSDSQLAIMGHNLCMLLVTVVYPLTQLTPEHRQLPVQVAPDIEQSLKSLLLNSLGFITFKQFLLNNARQLPQDKKYVDYLKTWSQIVLFKEGDPDLQQIRSFILDLDQQIISTDVCNRLMSSIADVNDLQGWQGRSSLNAALDSLDNECVENLVRIYKDRYVKTESFTALREIFQRYFRINVNMLQLDMTFRPVLQDDNSN